MVLGLLACELLVISPSAEVEEERERDASKGERRPEVEEARGLRDEVYQREWDCLVGVSNKITKLMVR